MEYTTKDLTKLQLFRVLKQLLERPKMLPPANCDIKQVIVTDDQIHVYYLQVPTEIKRRIDVMNGVNIREDVWKRYGGAFKLESTRVTPVSTKRVIHEKYWKGM